MKSPHDVLLLSFAPPNNAAGTPNSPHDVLLLRFAPPNNAAGTPT